MTKLKLSRFTKIIHFGNYICLFNALSLKKIFIDSRYFNRQTIGNIASDKNFSSNFDLRVNQFIQRLKNRFKPEFKQLYLIISGRCNLGCKYCRQITHQAKINIDVNFKMAREIIDAFFKIAKNSPSGIIFYGGEPLLNKPVLIFAIKKIRKKEKELKLKKIIDISIITNGTNIDEKTATFLKKMEVYIIISIDGKKEEHDKMRVNKSGRGSFSETLKGYKLYHSAGCRIGISCTVGKHNFKKLREIFDFFIKELKPLNVGINLPHDDLSNPLNIKGDYKKVYCYLLSLFFNYKDKIYIENINRKLKLLFEEKFIINDCPACGGRLVFLPDNRYGICEGAIGMDNFFSKDLSFAFDLSKQWFLTSPLFDKKCSGCLALGICGGGCTLDGYLQYGKIGYRDKRRCFFMKAIVKRGLKNFILAFENKIKNKNIFIPSKQEQLLFLNSFRALEKKLPLRSSAKYSSIKI